MPISFDDDHLNSSDRRKNSDNVKYNGGVDGIAKKWEKTHADKNTYNAAGGASMSRKQGTGELGREQTIASDGIDTSKMAPEEKFRYMQALGLLGDKPVQQSKPVTPPAQEQGYRMPNNRPVRRGSTR